VEQDLPVDKREAVASLLLRLRTVGIIDHRLFKAFESIPRQNFVPIIYLDQSYARGSFPIECGQIMTSADQVAKTLLALEVGAKDRVLEVGTGSGYQAALLSQLAGKVTTLERYRTLMEKARTRLENLKVTNVLATHADGIKGLKDALFDRIILNGSVSEEPRHLGDQLASNGIIVAPVGPADGEQELLKMTKVGSRFHTETLFTVRMQPLQKGTSKAI
jgi:protein-L-isoaspartate(D-aspartate) O-methyltransferase